MKAQLRIGSGKYRGRKLLSTKGTITRPVTGYCKKVLFDTCQGALRDASVLDLFAGSGALGLEALSRGAAEATFVEKDKSAFGCLQKNIEALGCQSQCHVFLRDAFSYLQETPHFYDVIFMDPPYPITEEICPPILEWLDQKYASRSCHVWVTCESEVLESLQELPLTHLHLECVKRHANTRLLYFKSA